MIRYRQTSQPGWKHQSGMTLVELLVAGAISIIASGGMVALMASTLGTGTQTIKMTRLSHEMRSAMQIMTRELRRANYHSSFATCFGDDNCAGTAGISSYIKAISIDGGSPGSCFWFWYDRNPSVAFANKPVAGFRHVTNDAGTGVFQMTTTLTGTPDCAASVDHASWTNITNPNIYDISDFEVSSDGLDVDGDGNIDIVGTYVKTINTAGSSLTVDRISITMTGQLVSNAALPTWMQGDDAPTLTLQDFIWVRNDISSS